MTRSIQTAPVYIDFDSGTNGSITGGHTAYFDNLSVVGGATAPGVSPAGLLVLAMAMLGGGALVVRRRTLQA